MSDPIACGTRADEEGSLSASCDRIAFYFHDSYMHSVRR